MAVREARVKITLTDAMSGPLRDIRGNLVQTNSAASDLSRTLKDFAGIAVGGAGIYSATEALTESIRKAVEFSKSLENETIGMSGILTSMTTLNGQTLEWNQALTMSKGIMKDLNTEALRTAATSEELITTFRALLGPGLGAGMSVDQIKDFTVVGVNAVKSMGLEGRQLVQELRDLVQGGIQPASSTLATALGLKDADIKAAKSSAEGLYSFLMARLAGFREAAEATPYTLRGMESQIEEGLTLSLSAGMQPILNEYKEVLQSIVDVVIDPDRFEISQDFISDISDASEHVVNMWHGFENIASTVEPVIVPALKSAGTILGLAADNVDKIAAGFAAWQLVGVVNTISQVKTSTEGLTQSQGVLNSAVSQYGNFWYAARNSATATIQNEMMLAEQAANTVLRAEQRKQTAIKQTEAIEKAANTVRKTGNIELSDKLSSLNLRYQAMGASAESAGKMAYQAAKLAAKGQQELATKVIATQEAHLQAAIAAETHAVAAQKLRSAVLTASNTVAAMGLVVSMAADEDNKLAQEMGNLAITAGVLMNAVVALTDALKGMADASGISFAAAATAAAGVTAAVAAIGYGAYQKYQHYQNGGEFTYDELGNVVPVDTSENDLAEQARRERWNKEYSDYQTAQTVNRSRAMSQNLDVKFPKSTGVTDLTSSNAKSESKEYERMVRTMNNLSAELDRKILEDTGSVYEVEMAKLEEELQKMQSNIDRANLAGVDTTEQAEKLAKYAAEARERVQRESLIKQQQLELDYIDAREEAEELSAQEADELRASQLTSYKAWLQQQLDNENLTLEQRLQLQQEYASAVTALQEAQATDWQASWGSVMTYIKNTQYDQLATMKSGVDDLLGTFTSFGQNMLTETKSWSERVDDLFTDLANSIMNTMMKVIMQGLVMNSIMSLFGLGGSTSFGVDASGISYQKFSGGTIVSSVPSSTLSFNADGGLAKGWSIVGEEGPELVNFSHPGRVYTASQTAAALSSSSSSGIESVKVVMENKSGTQMKTTQTSTTFNAKEMIINVVMDAVANNDGGINNILKGALT